MATDVSFYHLTHTDFQKALPSLLEKALAVGKRALLLAANEERVKNIDQFLWTFSTNRIVPHGTKADKYPEDQPVYITTTEENPNNSDVLVIVDGQLPDYVKDFSRTLDIFDGNDEKTVSDARKRWKFYKEEGMNLTYWKQDPKGAWQKQET